VRIAATLSSVDTVGAQLRLSGTGPRVTRPPNTHPMPAAPLSQLEGAQFTSLVASLIPCRNEDPELWFAEQAEQMSQAKALCAECPIVRACLAGALERGEPWGVWGGEIIVDGQIVAQKRGRGRPRKADQAA